MPRTLARALALTLALAALAGCERAADPAAADPPRPAIWEVTGADGTSEGWLFGTVHALPDDFAWRTPRLDAALGAADMLVVEVADLGDTAKLSQLFEAMAYDRPDGPIAARIAPERRAQFDRLVAKAGIAPGAFDRMESWAAALTLAQMAQTGRSDNGVDRALLARFKGREVVELEGARAQLAIFDGLAPAEQRDLLNAVLLETEDYEDEIGTLARTWRSGDTDRLAALTTRGILADAQLNAVLLVGRNRAWAAQIENLLSLPQRPFVAVGAGHLLGPQGLPALLAADGYAVRRIQ